MKHDRAKFRRCARVRRVLKSRSAGRNRLSVFRSSKQIYAQIIDDTLGKTLVSASSLETQMRSELTSGSDRQAAHRIGKLIAERAKKAGIEKVVFDRGGYAYHGRVQALADGAREEGLQF